MKTILFCLLICCFMLTACEQPQSPVETDATLPSSSAADPTVNPGSTTDTHPTAPTEPTMPTAPVLSDEEQLAARTALSESSYSWKVVCTPALDERGFMPQYTVYPVYIYSENDFMHKTSQLYDFTYTDDVFSESYQTLAEQYDDAFFAEHVLLTIFVITADDMIPQVRRIDIGEASPRFPQIVVYLDNTDAISVAKQVYQIFIELPLHCSIPPVDSAYGEMDYIGCESYTLWFPGK